MSRPSKPELWSDFDGTAVEIVSKFNPRNWSKYPLAGIPGYEEFLHGVLNEDVRIAGIISRRPNIAPRRYVTARSVGKLGLDRQLFIHPSQIVLTGSEEGKARHVVERSRDVRVGIIDDKPHRIGLALLDALLQEVPPTSEDGQLIALGVVSHGKSEDYTGRLMEAVGESDRDVTLSSNGDYPTFVGPSSNRFRLSVVQLDPYSVEAGNQFAHQIHAL